MKSVYLLAFLMITAASANAQEKRDTIHHASASQKKRMKDELGLSDKQAASIQASKKDYKQKEAKIKSDPKLTEAQKNEQIKQLKEEKKKEMNATLTPEQKEKAKEMKKEKAAKKKAEKKSTSK